MAEECGFFVKVGRLIVLELSVLMFMPLDMLSWRVTEVAIVNTALGVRADEKSYPAEPFIVEVPFDPRLVWLEHTVTMLKYFRRCQQTLGGPFFILLKVKVEGTCTKVSVGILFTRLESLFHIPVHYFLN